MHINTVNDTDFKGINSKKAHSVLFSRLNYKRYPEYKDFVIAQDNKDYDIVLSSRGKRSLEATVYDGEKVLLSMKENKLNGIFNLSPMKFLNKVASAAEKLYTSASEAKV
jgi:hypothetical protein